MKKIFSMAAIALFTMTSCSDDDSSSTNPDSNLVLPKKMVTIIDGETVTTDYTYNGNKLVSAVSTDGELQEYTYSGDKITECETSYNGALEQRDVYTYDGDNLTMFKMYLYDEEGAIDFISKNEYTYNADGTISIIMYHNYSNGGNEEYIIYDQGVITFNNGNLVSYMGDSDDEVYTFDDKNSVTKNIASNYYMALAFIEGGVNNILTDTYSINDVVDYMATSVYTYNSNNYPVTEVMTYGEETETYQYFYE
ncbi:hypothetical protein GCM10007424_15760 [Flavobacterium suaedae]|uniref:DUF4595 domain-containing protein n=1 Tax=Flavobacterium suaedae TaxID=1767027 RepID=A0ABQ1JSM8_9FLAO|nr:hypothetical protein [Flavobacterium suaedae]GGB76597.1 hypothetical protein GCM10007424_15760 [Flavobacterium suaedae]